jgi:hypothetical protein
MNDWATVALATIPALVAAGAGVGGAWVKGNIDARNDREATAAARTEDHRRLRQEAYARLSGQLQLLGTADDVKTWANGAEGAAAMAAAMLVAPPDVYRPLRAMQRSVRQLYVTALGRELTVEDYREFSALNHQLLEAMRADVEVG